MRPIKFKGKRIDNGEWAEGSYVDYWKESMFHHAIIDCDNYAHQIDPETLCEFTGLTDCNGKEIWEGDVVSIWGSIYSVEWVENLSLFSICRPIHRVASYPFVDFEKSKVIGNRFDNPELMEVQL